MSVANKTKQRLVKPDKVSDLISGVDSGVVGFHSFKAQEPLEVCSGEMFRYKRNFFCFILFRFISFPPI